VSDKKRFALLGVLKNRQAALLFTGQTISSLGDGVANIAIALIVLSLYPSKTQGALYLGVLGAARMATLVVFLLFGGVLADRVSRRNVLLISDGFRALITGSFIVAALFHHLDFWIILGGMMLFGAFDSIFTPALVAVTPELLDGDDVQRFTALRPLANNLFGNMIGPALGGLLSAISTTLALGVDAASFAFSFACLVAMHRTPKPAAKENASILGEIKEGVNYVRGYPWIWSALLSAGVSNAIVFIPVFILMPWFIIHDLGLRLHTARLDVGWVFALSGLAGAMGNYIVGSRPMPKRRIRAMWFAWISAGLTPLLFIVAHSIWLVALIPMLASPLLSFGSVIWETMLQTEVPGHLLGRVSSVDWFVSLGIAPFGQLVAGTVVGLLGMHDYAALAVGVSVIPALFVVTSRKVNAIDAGRIAGGSPTPTPEPSVGGN
jgi:hypothetical protein